MVPTDRLLGGNLARPGPSRRAHLRVAQFFDRNHALALKSFVKSLVDCAKASLAHQLNDTVASTKQTTNDQGSCYRTTAGGAGSGCIHRLSGNWANRATREFIPTVRAKLILRRVYRTLKLHAQLYTISMVLFGSYNLLIGYLIFRSTFLPRILGVLLAISGLCYLINCFANFLSPAFAAHLLPYILVPGGAELLLALWLVVIGVNVQRWKEQASAAGANRT